MATAGVALATTLAACGTSAPQPPSARSLAAKIGCSVDGPGEGFASYDTKQDLSLGGNGACLGSEVWTFPSQKDETDWLHQNQAASTATQYPEVAEGNLWVIYTGTPLDEGDVVSKLGGKIVSF